jgi:hypothetical protein
MMVNYMGWGVLVSHDEEREMQKIERVGALALVVDSSPPKDRNGATGHIVLDRYHIDEQGNVCLTNPGLSIDDLEGMIEVIKAELDALSMRARFRPPHEPMH